METDEAITLSEKERQALWLLPAGHDAKSSARTLIDGVWRLVTINIDDIG